MRRQHRHSRRGPYGRLRRALLVAVLAIATAAGAGGLSTQTAQAAVGDGPWSTEGSQIVDSAGNPVRITGINWFGLETENYTPHGLWARNYEDLLDQVRGLGYNTLRLPYSNELFDSDSTPSSIDYTLNPDLEGLTGLEIMDKVIDYAGEIGMKVILDRHRPDSASQSELWYTDEYSEDRWIDDWVMLADRYEGNDTVVGADLHNEPHNSATWGTGDTSTDWRLAAERAGNAVLEANPDWLIIVEGIDCYEGDCNWWGGNLKGARDYPVRLSNPDKLVYSTHEYATSVYYQDWFDDPDFPDNLPARWDEYWGYLKEEGTAPVLVGEFGSTLTAEKDQQWLSTLMEYLGTGTSGYDFTYWTLNPNSGDTGGILQDDWFTVDTNKQSYLDPYLLPDFSDGSDGGDGDGGDGDGDGDGGDDGDQAVSCDVTYSVASSWTDGFQASVTIENTGATAVDGWTVAWSFPGSQQISSYWNAEITQSGSDVTATNASWNGTLSANGGEASFGFIGTGSSSPSPTTFTVNGTTCTTS